MHPAMSHDLAQAYQEDLLRRAQRDMLVRHARRVRTAHLGDTAPELAAPRRRFLAVVGRQSWQPGQ
jgi:hypothetical protein